jgi:hypothetical protein
VRVHAAHDQENRPVGWLGQNWREFLFQIKIGLLNIPWLWKFVQGDLGGILMWGFFLNFSRLLKDFRKIKYAMPCNAMHPMQDYFLEGFLYARQFDMQSICTPMLTKFYFYKKWVLQT